VKSITDWFSSRKPAKDGIQCACGYRGGETLTFRSSNGSQLATADVPPLAAFGLGIDISDGHGQQAWFFADKAGGRALIDRTLTVGQGRLWSRRPPSVLADPIPAPTTEAMRTTMPNGTPRRKATPSDSRALTSLGPLAAMIGTNTAA